MQISYLGIDFGLKHIGVALAQTAIAQPLTTLANDQRLFEQLQVLLEKHQIQKIIVGHSTGSMSDPIKTFGAKLKAKFKLEVIYVDETLSTQEVVQKLRHTSKKKRQQLDHQFAATLILQDYLDFN